MPSSHFQVHTPAIREHASRTAQRAEEVQTHAQSVGSSSMGGGVLGELGGSTVETINSAHQRAGSSISGLSDRLSSTAERERTTASNYDEVEESNAQRFRTLTDEAPPPPSTTAHGGSGGSGGGGGGRGGTPGAGEGGQGWDGEGGLHLSPEENAAADNFLAKAKLAESKITPVVQDAQHAAPGSELLGYPDYVLKSEDSFKRKFATALSESPDRDTNAALADMKDSVRYTMKFPGEGTAYSDGVNSTLQRFDEAGIQPVKFKNSWGSPGYQGINSFWRDPSTGHVFEMQFHTQDSFDAKMVTHGLYEQQRLPDTTPEQAQALGEEQNRIFGSVPRPAGAGGIKPVEK